MSKVYVFYATLLYAEYYSFMRFRLSELPDGCYIYNPKDIYKKYWYLKDLTPVLPEDVPKELKTLALLMGV